MEISTDKIRLVQAALTDEYQSAAQIAKTCSLDPRAAAHALSQLAQFSGADVQYTALGKVARYKRKEGARGAR